MVILFCAAAKILLAHVAGSMLGIVSIVDIFCSLNIEKGF